MNLEEMNEEEIRKINYKELTTKEKEHLYEVFKEKYKDDMTQKIYEFYNDFDSQLCPNKNLIGARLNGIDFSGKSFDGVTVWGDKFYRSNKCRLRPTISKK